MLQYRFVEEKKKHESIILERAPQGTIRDILLRWAFSTNYEDIPWLNAMPQGQQVSCHVVTMSLYHMKSKYLASGILNWAEVAHGYFLSPLMIPYAKNSFQSIETGIAHGTYTDLRSDAMQHVAAFDEHSWNLSL